MKRLTRLAAVAVGVLAMVGAVTTPAHANTTAEITFTGTATVTGGIGYPNTLPIPPETPTTQCLDPLPDGNPVPNCHTHYTHHQRSVSFFSDNCVDAGVNVGKLTKVPAFAGPCSIVAPTGYVTGHCGLSGGQVTGTYVSSEPQVFEFNVHFSGVGGELVITGHVTKPSTGQSGKITAVVTAVPVIETPVLTTPNQSCTNKTQEDFNIVGEATGVTTT